MNTRLLLLVVVGAALLVYGNSLWNGFAYDDTPIIALNARVHHLGNLRDILFTPYWPGYGTELGLYRPLTNLAFAVQWSVVGNTPWFFHLINVLAHAAVCVLVFLLIRRLASEPAAFVAALLFALHPVHTEAVANVVGQAELWAALCVLGACLIHVARPAGTAIGGRRTFAILALYGLALLAKESAVVLPGLLVLLDVVQQRTRPFRSYVNAVAFLFVMCCLVLAGYLTLRLSVLGNLAGTDAAPGLPFLREQYRLLNALRAWPEYVRLLFFPFDLSVDYGPGVILPEESLAPMVLLGALLVASTVVLAIATPWHRHVGLVAGWFLLGILPVANFFFPIGVLIAERTLYLPSLAACFVAAFTWDRARQAAARESRRLAIAGVVVVSVAFAVRTVTRNPDWDSLDTVWQSLQRDHPEAYRSQWATAAIAWYHGEYPKAEQYYVLATRIWPRDSQLLNEFGMFYIAERKYDKAVDYLARSRDMTPFIVYTHEYLAYAYVYADRPREALASARRSLVMGGAQTALMYAVSALAYDKLGQPEQAAGAWRVAMHKKRGGLWLYPAMAARSLARAGYTAQALAAADTALMRARGREKPAATVRLLRAEIASGCYRQGGRCQALEGWVIGLPAPRPAVANSDAAAKRNAEVPSGGPEAVAPSDAK